MCFQLVSSCWCSNKYIKASSLPSCSPINAFSYILIYSFILEAVSRKSHNNKVDKIAQKYVLQRPMNTVCGGQFGKAARVV